MLSMVVNLVTRVRLRLLGACLGALSLLLSLPAFAGAGEDGREGVSTPKSHSGIVGLSDTAFVRQRHRRITFQFDQRYSLVDSRLAGINGLKLGIEWRGRYRAGAGLYLLSPGVKAITPGINGGTTAAELRFRYVAVYGEYVIRGNPRWEISTPVQLGYGKYYHEQLSPEGVRERSARDRVWLLEPTIGGHYRVFRWIGVGGGVGWREAFSVKPQYANQLDGPIFYGRVKLFLGDLYKVARGRQRLFTQRGLRRADWQQPALDEDTAEE